MRVAPGRSGRRLAVPRQSPVGSQLQGSTETPNIRNGANNYSSGNVVDVAAHDVMPSPGIFHYGNLRLTNQRARFAGHRNPDRPSFDVDMAQEGVPTVAGQIVPTVVAQTVTDSCPEDVNSDSDLELLEHYRIIIRRRPVNPMQLSRILKRRAHRQTSLVISPAAPMISHLAVRSSHGHTDRHDVQFGSRIVR